MLDHLGSVAVVTDNTGAVQTNGRLSYDAWGNRRLANGNDGTPATAPTTRGFTGHEMIDSVGLINMNGRVYDPYIGRFMSADPNTQSVVMMQLLNRYSYVGNNPLSVIDMTGYFLDDFFDAIGDAIAAPWEFLRKAIARTPALGSILSAIANIACIPFGLACNAAATALINGASGMEMGDILKGTFISFAMAAAFTPMKGADGTIQSAVGRLGKWVGGESAAREIGVGVRTGFSR